MGEDTGGIKPFLTRYESKNQSLALHEVFSNQAIILDNEEVFLVKNLTKSFAKDPLFKPVNFSLNKGDSLCLSGPNGVGKTTLLKCLAGYLHFKFDRFEWQQRRPKPIDCAFVSTSDQCFFPKLTVRENINFFCDFYRTQRNYDHWVRGLELDDFLDSHYQQCSTGIKKRLNLLRGFVKGSDVLLLDEPFANLDDSYKGQLKNLLEEVASEKVIIMASNHRHYRVANSTELKIEKWRPDV